MQQTFASRLQELRSERGLTRMALARRLGVSIPTLWGWESGKRKPRAHNMTALADALEVSTEFLRLGHGHSRGANGFSGSNRTLPGYVAEAKKHIANLAGVRPDKVTINIEY